MLVLKVCDTNITSLISKVSKPKTYHFCVLRVGKLVEWVLSFGRVTTVACLDHSAAGTVST